jgi:hypothetical protein
LGIRDRVQEARGLFFYSEQENEIHNFLLVDVTSERLSLVTLQLEEKEKSLMAAEAEVNALNR